MKSNTPTIALSPTLRDQKMVQNLFSRYYNIDVTKGSKLELSYSPDIDPARILILPTKEAINRIMSGDVSYCIATLKDMQECFA